MFHIARLISMVTLCLIVLGCASIPKGATVVENLEKTKYLGTWYEIARFDFVFEKDLSNTTAEYKLLADGTIGVTNRGYNYKNNRWQESNGVARFRGSDKVGALEVSFFGPFFAAYNIIQLDNDYKYALVVGSNLDYLWILSRENTIPEIIKKNYLELASSLGFNMDRLLWVEHNR